MHPLLFVHSDLDLSQQIFGQYNYWLVALSLLIAWVTCSTGLNHLSLMLKAKSKLTKRGWHFNGALTLGAGIWAMHFTGMMAFKLPIEVQFLTYGTLISVLPAVLSGYITLAYAVKPIKQAHHLWVAGTMMGAGIGTMHYLGMAAMTMPAMMYYTPSLFITSIFVAVALAIVALMVRERILRSDLTAMHANLVSAAIMAIAIFSMHFVAMLATVYTPSTSVLTSTQPKVGTLELSLAIFVVLVSSFVVHGRRILQRDVELSQAQAQEWANRFNAVATRVPGVLFTLTQDPLGKRRFTYVSAAVENYFGFDAEHVLQNPNAILACVNPDDLTDVIESLDASAKSDAQWQQQFRTSGGDQKLRWLQVSAQPEHLENGSVCWHGFLMDITDQKSAEDTIERLAYFDELTGLANRRLFTNRLNHALAIAKRRGTLGALMFLDLDEFKRLNDVRGHAQGDLLLQKIAKRLQSHSRAEDTVARFGGDEFVICLGQLGTSKTQAQHEAQIVARRILESIHKPYDLDGNQYQCSASLGLCLFGANDSDVHELMRQADTAMYQAKNAGKNTMRFFDPVMHQEMEQRYQLELDLDKAVVENQLQLYLQRQVDRDGITVGAEALIRWNHPSRGLISPALFIPLAEETGQIIALGEWVLQQAFILLQDWQQHPITEQWALSINVSARQFRQPDFTQNVLAQIEASQINPQRLTLELTETLVLQDIDDTLEKIKNLKDAGVSFSMDDFGTGYSSLSYLSRLPFNEVKIDQAFIRSADNSKFTTEWVIVEAILSIGNKLKLVVVAEGVETQLQAERLINNGCDVLQGYYFGLPLPAHEWLKRELESQQFIINAEN